MWAMPWRCRQTLVNFHLVPSSIPLFGDLCLVTDSLGEMMVDAGKAVMNAKADGDGGHTGTHVALAVPLRAIGS